MILYLWGSFFILRMTLPGLLERNPFDNSGSRLGVDENEGLFPRA